MEKQTQLIKNTELFSYLRALLLLKDVDVDNLLTVEVKKEDGLVLINDVAIVNDEELEPINFHLEDLDNIVYMVEEQQETIQNYQMSHIPTEALEQMIKDFTDELDELKWQRLQLAKEIEEVMDKKSMALEQLAENILNNSNKNPDNGEVH